MSTTDAARESARRPDGQFGVQRRSELDPANAGLGEPEAPLPTWGEALAHAEVLREQGANVWVDEDLMWIEICDTNGDLHDPADGTPAVQSFYPDGSPAWISHYTNGERHDPGTPAVQGFCLDGTPKEIGYYRNGELVSITGEA